MADDLQEIEKYLVLQEGVSNKFWQVQTDGAQQTVRYGRVGTDGRESVKDFADAAICRRDTEKLVSQKLRKGYVEVADESAVPEKAELTEDERAELMFWDAIESSNKWKKAHWSEYDIDEHLENLTTALTKKSKNTLVQFQRQLVLNLNALYTAQIAELYTVLNNKFSKDGDTVFFDRYISADGFLYFRCWLLLKGRAFVEDITADVDVFVNGKYSFDIGDCWAEGLLTVADMAYAEKNGTDPDDAYAIDDALRELDSSLSYDRPPDIDREPLAGAELQRAHPRLVADIVAIR
ncbi:MAG: DUF4240 domain-containing protein [Micrococcales bacterium]|nr:DUF4240 domain-containing protein [Micrococcales bacterium]MCL2666227.1 DUF4240 domain-containing protein [Micrococcales bacterium]